MNNEEKCTQQSLVSIILVGIVVIMIVVIKNE